MTEAHVPTGSSWNVANPLALGTLFSYALAQLGLSAMNTLVNTQVPFF